MTAITLADHVKSVAKMTPKVGGGERHPARKSRRWGSAAAWARAGAVVARAAPVCCCVVVWGQLSEP